MKKSLSILTVIIVSAMLSGCILYKAPNTNNVTMKVGEQQTFTATIFPTVPTYCSWTFDGAPISNTGRWCTYTALAGEHILIVIASHVISTYTQTWHVYGNSPPVANSGADQSVYFNSEVTLDGSGSTDPDNDIVSYTWQHFGGPAVSLTNVDKAIFPWA
jgi:hypothetical protein